MLAVVKGRVEGNLLEGLTCERTAERREPSLRLGARMKVMPVKRKMAARTVVSRGRKKIARLRSCQAVCPK